MGQCYTVVAELKFGNNDPAAFCDMMKKEAAKRKYLQGEKYDLDNPFDCFKMITTNNAYTMGDKWEADFDASYSWSGVLEEVFSSVMELLEDGSYVYVEPDDYHFVIRKNNNKVEIEWYNPDEDDLSE